MEIIDARSRPPVKAFQSAYQGAALDAAVSTLRRRGWTPSPAIIRGDLDLFFQEAKRAGVVSAGLPGRAANALWSDSPNALVFDACREFPDFFFAYASVDPSDPKGPDSIAGLKDAGAKGIVIETGICAQPIYADDPSLNLLYESCRGANLPVLLMGGGEAGPDVSFCAAVHIDRLAIRFPELQIVNVHGGWPYAQENLGVAYFRPNVWILPDCYFPGLPGELDYVRAIETFLQDRFLFATGFPYCPIIEMVERYQRLGLTARVMEKIMSANARRLFGI